MIETKYFFPFKTHHQKGNFNWFTKNVIIFLVYILTLSSFGGTYVTVRL